MNGHNRLQTSRMMTDPARHQQNIAYCQEQVQQYAEDLVIAARFAPRDKYNSIIAVYAFACEINRVPASVTEATLGAIRQQWWREALEEIAKGKPVRAHPVVEALISVVNDPDPGQNHYEQLGAAIDALDPLLEPADFHDVAEILALAWKTHGSIAGIAAKILDPALSPSDQEQVEVLETLCAVARIAAYSGQVPKPASDGPETFTNRVLRYLLRDANRQNLIELLTSRLNEAYCSDQHIPSVQMPAIAQASLLRSYIQQIEDGDRHAGHLWGVKKRYTIFRTVLTGRF